VRCTHARFSFPKTSAPRQPLDYSRPAPPTKPALTHRHTRCKPTHRNNAPNLTHMRWPPLRRKLINERGKRVEQEILDHHLQDKDFRRVGAERVAGSTTGSAHVTTLSEKETLEVGKGRLTGCTAPCSSPRRSSQNTPHRSRTSRDTPPLSNRVVPAPT
jgi:hypothetical protein